METLRLRAVQQPSQVESLLVAFASDSGVVGRDGHILRDELAIPAALQGEVARAVKQVHAWCCWTDDSQRVWLITGQMSLALSRDCGLPVLDVKVYCEQGTLTDDDCWLLDREGKWRRCSVTSIDEPPRRS